MQCVASCKVVKLFRTLLQLEKKNLSLRNTSTMTPTQKFKIKILYFSEPFKLLNSLWPKTPSTLNLTKSTIIYLICSILIIIMFSLVKKKRVFKNLRFLGQNLKCVHVV